ncbi:unnamed protein product [Echinostoma caproni]|uniref:AcidPPc domain-containing protein n=1 Tax=Echinostoma caproni TaxID=27848 RepID=A0A183AYZ0_9TREM|nr:unnamed protein product [Echinostoma caproni]
MDLESHKSRLAAKVTTDLLVAILLHVSYFFVKLAGHPTRGFFCDDYSIRYPYKPDTVSSLAVVLYGYLIPLLTVNFYFRTLSELSVQIILLELLIAVYRRFSQDEDDAFKEAWPPIYNYGIAFLIAAGLTLAVTTVIKYTLGRLRPHFLDACKPDTFSTTCTGFIDKYTCQNTNKKIVEDAL